MNAAITFETNDKKKKDAAQISSRKNFKEDQNGVNKIMHTPMAG
jgi:hypothetical protein